MIETTSAASMPSRSVTRRASSMGGFGGGAGPAAAENLEPVPLRLEAVGAADLGPQRHDAPADELDHPPAALAGQVVVLLAGMNVLVERASGTQPLPAHQTAFDEQIQVAIHRGAGNGDAAPAQRVQESSGVEVGVLLEDLLANGPPLGGHPETPLMDKVFEDFEFSRSAHGPEILRR